MTNLFKMIKQASTLQREMKQIQKQLAGMTVDATSPDRSVKVTARGDMTVAQIAIDSSALQNPPKMEKQIAAAVNEAIERAKKMAAAEMSKLTAGMNLPGMEG